MSGGCAKTVRNGTLGASHGVADWPAGIDPRGRGHRSAALEGERCRCAVQMGLRCPDRSNATFVLVLGTCRDTYKSVVLARMYLTAGCNSNTLSLSLESDMRYLSGPHR